MKPAVLMIGGGVQQVDAARVVRGAGYRLIVSDRNGEAPAFRHADESWEVDGNDTNGLIRRALEAKNRGLAGVFTLTELVESVARVACAAGLPGVAPDAASACQDKARAKKLWVAAGVATARAGVVSDMKRARALFSELGRSVFLKPSTGAGGLGASAVTSIDALEVAFERAAAVSRNVLIEEKLEGTHHDVNAIIDSEGTFRSAGLADRRFAEGFPVELEASAPTVLTRKQQLRALELTHQAARALGIRFGPIKSDLILTDKGFRILELAPRLHGPKGTLHLLPLAFGFHPLNAALRVLTGMPLLDSHLEPRHQRAALIVAIPGQPGRRLQSMVGLEEANHVPGIHGIRILVRIGTTMPALESNADVLGHIFATGPNMAAARKAADSALAKIELITDVSPRE